MCIYEKLRRIHVCLKEEENACQVLASVSVYALSRNFDMAVENKRGISNLELLYEELSREEKLKEQRKEQKKLKKRKKRNERRRRNSCENCGDDLVLVEEEEIPVEDKTITACDCSDNDDDEEEVTHAMTCCAINNGIDPEEEIEDDDKPCADSCHSCNADVQHSLDAGYSSETHHEGSCSRLSSSETTPSSSINTSPEGSEIACSDAFCNHHDSSFATRNKRTSGYETNECSSKGFGVGPGGFTSSLAQMLVSNVVDFPIETTLMSFHFRMKHTIPMMMPAKASPTN